MRGRAKLWETSNVELIAAPCSQEHCGNCIMKKQHWGPVYAFRHFGELLFAAAFVVFSLVSLSASAQDLSQEELPDSLRPWVPWVESELGEQACAHVGDSRACVWPGRLVLALDSSGGEFRQQVSVGAKTSHVLPGQRGAWPQEVSVGGRELPVLAKDGVPLVELPAGEHEIKGRFEWERIPETLHVGPHTAFLDLEIGGTAVPLVKRDGGNIWLKGLSLEAESGTEPELAELTVFRQIRDGIPLQVETLIVFQISGKAREISFDQPLLRGTVPLSVDGDLAVGLEANGQLRVQLVPGRHEVRLLARGLEKAKELRNQSRAAPWPVQEVWTWHPATELRGVEVNGAPGIDASRTSLPAAWRQDSAYSVEAEGGLSFRTTRRGQEQIPPNRVALKREFWLDERARAFTVRDSLSGTLNQKWRLDLQSGELGQVSVGGDSQVITLASNGARGVELRDSQLQMTAVSRVARAPQLRAVGWSEDVDSLRATVHLPPGWDLFAAQGVDSASNTWLSEWDLFSVFYLLLMTLGAAKVLGLPGAVVTALVLVLGHGESDAPQYIWLPLVGGAALLAVLKEGRLRSLIKWCFYALSLVFILSLASFSVDQVRYALYPHLNSHYPDAQDFSEPEAAMLGNAQVLDEAPGRLEDAEAPAAPEAAPEVRSRGVKELSMALESKQQRLPVGKVKKKGGITRSAFGGSYDYKSFKPDAIVQTGPGIPDVSSESWELSWSGPVARDHEFRLYLVSPTLQKLLTVLRLSSMLALAYFLFVAVRRGRRGPGSGQSGASRAGVASLVMSMMLAFLWPSSAQAEQPSDARLAQLKAKLAESETCAPHCISVTSLGLELDEHLTIVSQVSAGGRSAYKLPGPATAFSRIQLRVDGKEATAVRLESDGAYYLRLERGVHRVEIEAELRGERVTLDLGDAPELIRVEAEGWTVSGVNELGRAPGGTLTLQRERSSESSETATGTAQKDQTEQGSEIAVPPYFIVTRALSLGVTAQIVTKIKRLSESTRSEVLKVKLISGETVTTPGVETVQRFAHVSFSREATEIEFTSNLALPESSSRDWRLSLQASQGGQTSESWLLECGVVWHCEPTGLVATSHQEQARSVWSYHPWPGETLTIEAHQPLPAPGSSLTVQKATLKLIPGVRMSRGELEMLVQTSRATIHQVKIPKGAKLESVEVNGTAQAVRSEEGSVGVALTPGLRRVRLTWQQKVGLTSWFRSPKVDAGAAGVNFRTVLDLPSRRWLLFAWGPSQGPAILMWGYLVLILAGSLILARLPFSPLKSYQWIILGLGLTQVPSFVALLVAGWFFAIGSRNRWPRFGRYRHNLLHLGLLGYSFVFLIVLTVAVYQGLVSSPDMEVVGAGSYGHHLIWVSDRSEGSFAPVGALSLSIWVWRGFMLAWALWLSRSLIAWLKWAWMELQTGSFWITKPVAQRPATPPSPAVGAPPTSGTSTPRAPETQEAPVVSPESEDDER